MKAAMTAETDRLEDVSFDGSIAAPRTPELEQERRVAVFDLLEGNTFGLKENPTGASGPWQLKISQQGHQLVFSAGTGDRPDLVDIPVPLAGLQQVVRDYAQICESYFDAVRHLPPSRIEAIDEGRRTIHDEGSRILLGHLEKKVDTDMATARRLFTIVCALTPGDR